MPLGDLLGLLGYGSFSTSDAFTKAAGQQLSAYEVIFFLTLFWPLPLSIAYAGSRDWRHAFRPHLPGLVWTRAVLVAVSSLMSVFAFTNLPMSDAYALLFLSPLFVAGLAVLVLREKVGKTRWLAILLGLSGVLIAVRPNFSALNIGHFAALAGAVLGACNVALLRRIGGHETTLTLLATLWITSLAINGALMVPGFVMPTARQWLWLACGGTGAALGHLGIASAIRRTPASRLAALQYSQMIWGLLYGVLFFGDRPDGLKIAGIAMIFVSGLLNLARGRT